MGADAFGDLWTCPRCGRRFANRNQSHTCGRWTLAHHLDDEFAAWLREAYEVGLQHHLTRHG